MLVVYHYKGRTWVNTTEITETTEKSMEQYHLFKIKKLVHHFGGSLNAHAFKFYMFLNYRCYDHRSTRTMFLCILVHSE